MPGSLLGKTVPSSSNAVLVIFPTDKYTAEDSQPFLFQRHKQATDHSRFESHSGFWSCKVLKSSTLSHVKYTPVLYDEYAFYLIEAWHTKQKMLIEC